MDLDLLIKSLSSSDNEKAYESLKELENISMASSEVYSFVDTFVGMLSSDNSYIRVRGFLLIAANARWDFDNKIDGAIDKLQKCVSDEKPITARQCIKVLPTIVKYKPGLKDRVVNALQSVDLSKYKENMQALILKDIRQTLNEIDYS